jgi:hypothetical protein
MMGRLQGYRIGPFPVVPTKAPLDFARGKLHAAWRDLLSTLSCLSMERRSLDYAAPRAAPLGTTDN